MTHRTILHACHCALRGQTPLESCPPWPYITGDLADRLDDLETGVDSLKGRVQCLTLTMPPPIDRPTASGSMYWCQGWRQEEPKFLSPRMVGAVEA